MQLRFACVAFFVTAAVFLSPVRGRPAAAPEDPAWNKVVAAAKKEAKVVIIGPLGSEARSAQVSDGTHDRPILGSLDHITAFSKQGSTVWRLCATVRDRA